MKAAQINEYGTDVVVISRNVNTPEIASGKVLVKVHAAGVNPFDWKIREGHVPSTDKFSFPITLGGDFAGTVMDVGQGVTLYRTGDHVYGSGLILSGGSGAFAEFVLASEKLTALKPEKASYLEAAALPLTGVSAWDVLFDKMKLQKGQKILIHGGSGGIGSMAIQMAKYLGAHVATTARKDKSEYLKTLGADEIIDYKDEVFEEKLKDFDAAFDTVGGDTYKRSFKVLKKGGIIVSMLEQPDQELMDKYQVNAVGQSTRINSHQLKKLAELFDSGVVTVTIDRVFPLEETGQAMEYQRTGSVKGKVVIEIA
ncbi:NADPH:quinone reductase Zn-dependent oxidoreductase [Methanolobus psychrophilus R15]|nr:NADPH:quinone reductase Zn-dependent oxidoreductase [Methanolobus psychrophilus R15]